MRHMPCVSGSRQQVTAGPVLALLTLPCHNRPQHIIRIPVANMGGTKTIGPRPRFYAVIQMDPKAMIRDWKLDDEQALKEVEEMRPQKYLIYLDTVSFVHVQTTFRSCILEFSPFFA